MSAGIPEEFREKIFDPLFTIKKLGKSMGQGLSVARSMVDEHGGSLGVESEVDVGTASR